MTRSAELVALLTLAALTGSALAVLVLIVWPMLQDIAIVAVFLVAIFVGAS